MDPSQAHQLNTCISGCVETTIFGEIFRKQSYVGTNANESRVSYPGGGWLALGHRNHRKEEKLVKKYAELESHTRSPRRGYPRRSSLLPFALSTELRQAWPHAPKLTVRNPSYSWFKRALKVRTPNLLPARLFNIHLA